MLTKYGIDNIVVMLLVAIILLVLAIVFFKGTLSNSIFSIILFVCSGLLFVFTFWFFRDPDRFPPSDAINDSSIIISPADGIITEIVTEYEKNYLKEKSIRISIFLSPLDVHVNRIPSTGIIEYLNYIPGKYIIANHPKASELNEQSHIGLNTKAGKIFFKQIVGIIARRLVYDIKVGDSVTVGDRFGMMKFGSRMDIALPMDCKVLVQIGDKVVAGQTKIAKLK